MTPTRLTMALVAALSLVAACGGGSDSDADSEPAADTTAAAQPDTTADTDTTTGDGDDEPTVTEPSDDDSIGGVGDYDPSDVEYRVVNVLDVPVDVYGRTMGLVEAYLIEASVAPGTVTDLVAPPADGILLITDEGADDITCVSTCDHFIAELSTYPEEGPVRTVVLYNDETGEPSAFDMWESPGPDRQENSNSMPAADPATGFVVVTAVPVIDTDFGLRIAEAGVAGCIDPMDGANVLIGGNQTPAFAYDGDSVDFVIHGNEDRECAEAPIGGPFTIDGGPGTRTHLILTGTIDDLDAVVLTMIEPGGTSGGSVESTADAGDRSLAIELLADEMID
ncbi:MAG: hypothetical protein WBP59_07340, partial [Ilumatobacteraceae bacterium]